ncbi:MAG TPA: glycosyltransferase family A protein [Thermoanaerobaculia bacterium]|nr:glycosyltransferase family A protein [Thermoanaerobaculia bacterium]
MEPGLVTTILPVYNRAAMLREAVASVIAQTYRPVEIVIVDDGSTDDTPRVADELGRLHPEARVVHQPNGGPGVARESGRALARGEFIQHLDSDDVLLPRKLELQVAALRAHPECGAAYGITRWRRRDGTLDPHAWGRTGERIDTMFPAMLQSRWWTTHTPLYRAALLDAAGPWLPLRIEEDWEYDARVASRNVRLCFVDEEVAEVRSHEEPALSGRVTQDSLRDRARAHEAILGHARRAGIAENAPEMRHFSRELFLLARQCGAAGLARESERLFSLARDASGQERDRLQFRLYAALARTAGWSTAGKLATMSDRLRWRSSRS